MPAASTHLALLAPDEPPAFYIEREHGPSPFFIICDHAGALIPKQLGTLGLSSADLRRHIAWDIGAAGVARALGAALDACVILQTYSRLVIDCNRPPGSPTSIATVSEHTAIPGNVAISAADAERREREVFRPYHDRIRALLDARRSRGQATVLISMHSFTPVYMGEQRPWHAAVLYNRDGRLSRALLSELQRDSSLVLGENEPYAVSDTSDYAIPEYGEKLRLPHVEIEIRQDLIADQRGQQEWAERLANALPRAAKIVDAA
jgi:predicted N-formylglutamate amidohydrolase